MVAANPDPEIDFVDPAQLAGAIEDGRACVTSIIHDAAAIWNYRHPRSRRDRLHLLTAATTNDQSRDERQIDASGSLLRAVRVAEQQRDQRGSVGDQAATGREVRWRHHRVRGRRRPRTDVRQPACGSAALIAHWAAKARSYAGRASPRAT